MSDKVKGLSDKITYVCSECGSENVRCDAFAEWDKEKQQWVLHSTYDDTWCEDCEDDCKLDEVKL